MEFIAFLKLVCIMLYFLPVFFAIDRNHPQKAPIIVLNIFLGWTLIGWVICLAWSLSSIDKQNPT